MTTESVGSESQTRGADHCQVIAIDGPAAAGKTTIARALATRLDAVYLDTGALYRAVTLAALRAGVPPTNGEDIASIAQSLDLQIRPATTPGGPERVFADGEDVTEAIRSPEVDATVSIVAAQPEVRAALLPIQRDIASRGRVIMAGRDITTVVVPDAGVRIFLNASPEVRAQRRYRELVAKGHVTSYEEVLRDILQRDLIDSTREIAPLHAAPGVTIVETDGRDIDDIVEEIAHLALRTWESSCHGAVKNES
ncbi:MAG TPA: (d)CMP kinase [Thermomicrobiales bacterium]